MEKCSEPINSIVQLKYKGFLIKSLYTLYKQDPFKKWSYLVIAQRSGILVYMGGLITLDVFTDSGVHEVT